MSTDLTEKHGSVWGGEGDSGWYINESAQVYARCNAMLCSSSAEHACIN